MFFSVLCLLQGFFVLYKRLSAGPVFPLLRSVIMPNEVSSLRRKEVKVLFFNSRTRLSYPGLSVEDIQKLGYRWTQREQRSSNIAPELPSSFLPQVPRVSDRGISWLVVWQSRLHSSHYHKLIAATVFVRQNVIPIFYSLHIELEADPNDHSDTETGTLSSLVQALKYVKGCAHIT